MAPPIPSPPPGSKEDADPSVVVITGLLVNNSLQFALRGPQLDAVSCKRARLSIPFRKNPVKWEVQEVIFGKRCIIFQSRRGWGKKQEVKSKPSLPLPAA